MQLIFTEGNIFWQLKRLFKNDFKNLVLRVAATRHLGNTRFFRYKAVAPTGQIVLCRTKAILNSKFKRLQRNVVRENCIMIMHAMTVLPKIKQILTQSAVNFFVHYCSNL
jgi:hypothetical protein